MPFLERAGLGDGMEKFDFGVDGVTSISCDIVGFREALQIHLTSACSTNTHSVRKVELLNPMWALLTLARLLGDHVPIPGIAPISVLRDHRLGGRSVR